MGFAIEDTSSDSASSSSDFVATADCLGLPLKEWHSDTAVYPCGLIAAALKVGSLKVLAWVSKTFPFNWNTCDIVARFFEHVDPTNPAYGDVLEFCLTSVTLTADEQLQVVHTYLRSAHCPNRASSVIPPFRQHLTKVSARQFLGALEEHDLLNCYPLMDSFLIDWQPTLDDMTPFIPQLTNSTLLEWCCLHYWPQSGSELSQLNTRSVFFMGSYSKHILRYLVQQGKPSLVEWYCVRFVDHLEAVKRSPSQVWKLCKHALFNLSMMQALARHVGPVSVPDTCLPHFVAHVSLEVLNWLLTQSGSLCQDRLQAIVRHCPHMLEFAQRPVANRLQQLFLPTHVVSFLDRSLSADWNLLDGLYITITSACRVALQQLKDNDEAQALQAAKFLEWLVMDYPPVSGGGDQCYEPWNVAFSGQHPRLLELLLQKDAAHPRTRLGNLQKRLSTVRTLEVMRAACRGLGLRPEDFEGVRWLNFPWSVLFYMLEERLLSRETVQEDATQYFVQQTPWDQHRFLMSSHNFKLDRELLLADKSDWLHQVALNTDEDNDQNSPLVGTVLNMLQGQFSFSKKEWRAAKLFHMAARSNKLECMKWLVSNVSLAPEEYFIADFQQLSAEVVQWLMQLNDFRNTWQAVGSCPKSARQLPMSQWTVTTAEDILDHYQKKKCCSPHLVAWLLHTKRPSQEYLQSLKQRADPILKKLLLKHAPAVTVAGLEEDISGGLQFRAGLSLVNFAQDYEQLMKTRFDSASSSSDSASRSEQQAVAKFRSTYFY